MDNEKAARQLAEKVTEHARSTGDSGNLASKLTNGFADHVLGGGFKQTPEKFDRAADVVERAAEILRKEG